MKKSAVKSQPTVTINDTKAVEFLSSLTVKTVQEYKTYWYPMRPQVHEDSYFMYLFAFLSVQRNWEQNVRCFKAVKELHKKDNWDVIDLEKVLKNNGAGMYSTLLRGLPKFNKEFWANPDDWYPKLGENILDARNRILTQAYGIGPAKTAFVMEMFYPSCSEVFCSDRHCNRLFGVQNPTDKQQLEIEKLWVKNCSSLNVPGPMARHIFWDQLHKQPSSRYWSHVLESRDGVLEGSAYKSARDKAKQIYRGTGTPDNSVPEEQKQSSSDPRIVRENRRLARYERERVRNLCIQTKATAKLWSACMVSDETETP